VGQVNEDEPRDGFTVSRVDGMVRLEMTDVYGEGDVYDFPPRDAVRIATPLLHHAARELP